MSDITRNEVIPPSTAGLRRGMSSKRNCIIIIHCHLHGMKHGSICCDRVESQSAVVLNRRVYTAGRAGGRAGGS